MRKSRVAMMAALVGSAVGSGGVTAEPPPGSHAAPGVVDGGGVVWSGGTVVVGAVVGGAVVDGLVVEGAAPPVA